MTVTVFPDRAGPTADAKRAVLSIDHLTVTARPASATPVDLVRDVSFAISEGEVACLVGESGSGKSVTARTILGLTALREGMAVRGQIELDGRDLVTLTPPEARAVRGRDVAMVFQEPLSALDPVFTVENQLFEVLRRAGPTSRRAARARAVELLGAVGIADGDRVLHAYPHRLSGGMCQRIMIAMALACSPRLLVADEPTTALDVTIQAQILELIDRLRQETGMAVLLITHDMGVAADIADRVIVMYAGRVVEDADLGIFATPRHPYTRGLLACIPPITGPRPESLPAIPGHVPHPGALPTGCAFHPRCERASVRCTTDDPPMISAGTIRTACWQPHGAAS